MSTEKRLIDANAEIATIKENVCKNCNSYGGVRCRACWVDDAIGFLDDAPSVDAVEVVRCKDCQYYYCQRCSNPANGWLPNRGTLDFCSFAERRTDNGRI